MSFQLSYDLIKKIVPSIKVAYLKPFVDTFNANSEKYGITSQRRFAAFISQVAHESDGFKTTKEYASGAAYEGRKDLGNIYKGDGVRFKGRGFIETTGRTNYGDTSNHLFGDKNKLLKNPELLEDPINATLSAMYFWKKHGLNEIADKPDNWTIKTKKKGTLNKFQYVTYIVNGGQNGLTQRAGYWEKAKTLLGAAANVVSDGATAVAKKAKDNTGLVLLFVGVGAAYYIWHSNS